MSLHSSDEELQTLRTTPKVKNSVDLCYAQILFLIII